MKISLIISTYNWSEALEASLTTACRQNYADYEVIVADDGSQEPTREVIERVSKASGRPIVHAWHADKGFRLAMIRNRAVAKATGDYLVFVDGDCLLSPDFLTTHAWLAEKRCFVAGSRVQLGPQLTQSLLVRPDKIPTLSRKALIGYWTQGHVRRIHPIIRWPFNLFRHRRPQRWQGAVGCNIAVWRRDYLAVNGFDNAFIGWGLEDSEFIMRLLHHGLTRKDGKLGSYVLHLHHKKGSGVATENNQARFQATLQQKLSYAESGLNETTQLD